MRSGEAWHCAIASGAVEPGEIPEEVTTKKEGRGKREEVFWFGRSLYRVRRSTLLPRRVRSLRRSETIGGERMTSTKPLPPFKGGACAIR